MWKNKEQPVVKTGKMCRIAQNYEHGRALPLHAVRWLGIMIDSQNIPLRRMSTNEIRYWWIIGLFISQYTFIKLNISHIYELFRYINPCIHIYFHDKLVRNWCGKWENNILGNEFITTDYFQWRIKNYIYGIHKHHLIDLKLYRSPLEHPAGISF